MLKIAVIGGGRHSCGSHLPSLTRYAFQHPDEISLVAFCDASEEVAMDIAGKYGFHRCYTDIGEMLAQEGLDGCIAITPVTETTDVAKQVISAGVPLLMEKPPGRTPDETKDICELTSQTNTPVMVSMNRRFHPGLCAANSWRGDRSLAYVKATMLRNRRTEKDFFKATAIHGLDTLRSIAGNINDYSVDAQQVADVSWYHIQIAFDNGVAGLLDVMPSCGSTAESYEMYGADCRVVAYVNGESAGKIEAWENGKIVHCSEPAQEMPSFVQDGTFAETFEFINALQENRSPYPSPSQVWQSVELCDRIQCGSGAWR